MIPTPETDAELERPPRDGDNVWVRADFARKLERERDEISDRFDGLVLAYKSIEAAPHERNQLQKKLDEANKDVADEKDSTAYVLLEHKKQCDPNTQFRKVVDELARGIKALRAGTHYDVLMMTSLDAYSHLPHVIERNKK